MCFLQAGSSGCKLAQQLYSGMAAAPAAAAPPLPPVSAYSAIDSAYDMAAVRAKRRKLGGISESALQLAVSKAIRDNMREMMPEEMDGVRDDNGFTCRERLSERKKLNHENPAAYPCGKHFYNCLKDQFAHSESPKKCVAQAAAKVATRILLHVLGGVYTR